MTERRKKEDGFRDEKYYIIPTELFGAWMEHPLVRGLYLTDVGYFPKAKDHYKERSDGAEQHILIYCMEGGGYVELGDDRIHLTEYQAICIPAGRKHCYYADEEKPWSILWMHFKGENAAYFPLNSQETITMTSPYSRNRMVTLFQMLFRVLDGNYSQGNFIYISQLASSILAEVYFREKVEDGNSYDRHVTRVVRYMLQNLDRTLTLQDISDEVRLSKSYLNSIFKTQTGRAPVDFFIHLKMQEACKLLKSSDLYIYQISARMGYEDPYYFSRIFKKVVGVSPKEYKEGEFFFM